MDVLFCNALNAGGDAGIVYDAPLPLTFEIRTLEYAALGGALRAEIKATGAIAALQMLAGRVSRGVEIRDEKGGVVWRGIVFEVAIADGYTQHTYTIQGVVNSAAIAYYKVSSSAESVGTRTMSDWSDNTASVSRYGKIQMLLSGGKMTEAEAAQRLSSVLLESSLPYSGSEARRGDAGATIICVGAWEMMGREYYRDLSSLHVYTPQPTYQQWFGEGSGLAKVATRICLPGNPTVSTGGGLVYESFKAHDLTVRLAKWIDMPERLPDASTLSGSENPGQPRYRVCCELYTDTQTRVADCHRGRTTPYTEPPGQRQDLNAEDTRVFITRIGGFNNDYGRGGQHNVSPSPKWFVTGDKIIFGFVDGNGNITLGDTATITGVDTVAHGFYDVQRGENALAQSNCVLISLPGTAIARAYVKAEDIPQTSPGQVTFTDFRDNNNQLYSFEVSSYTPVWFMVYRTDPPTGAQGQYLRRGYYIVDGSTEMGYTSADKPLLAQSFTMRGASLVYDQPNDVWRHCIPARDNSGGAQIWFKISGVRQTTDQLSAIASNSQWLSGCIIEHPSGKYTVPYRNGERSLQTEIENLLRLGDSSGKAYDAKVDEWGRLVVSLKEDGTQIVNPFSGSVSAESHEQRAPVEPIIFTNDGRLVSPGGAPLPLLPPPIGKYVKYESAVDAPPFYVETAVYVGEDGSLELRAPNKGASLNDIGGVEEG
jgi:hypothetical protein